MSSRKIPDVTESLLLAAAMSCAIIMLVRTTDAAKRSRQLWYESHLKVRIDAGVAPDPSRQIDLLRSIEGAVLDSHGVSVASAEVTLVDLVLLSGQAPCTDLLSALPEECIEATTRTEADGTYQFRNYRLGPKAILARHGHATSVPNWILRCIDGVPVRGADVHLAKERSRRVELLHETPTSTQGYLLSPIWSQMYFKETPATEVARDGGLVPMVDGRAVSAFLVRDPRSGAVKIRPVETGSDSYRMRLSTQDLKVLVPGISDGEYAATVDDLEFGIPNIGRCRITVREQVARIPMLARGVCVSFIDASSSSAAVVRVPVGGGKPSVRVVDPRAESLVPLPVSLVDVDRERLAVYAYLAGEDVASGHLDDRLSLLRTGRRVKCRVSAEGRVTLPVVTALRFRNLVLKADESEFACISRRGTDDGAAPVWSAPGNGVCRIRAPWPYSWVGVYSDAGLARAARAPPSRIVEFRDLPTGVPLIFRSHEGAYGLADYRPVGAVLRGSNVRLLRVDSRSMRGDQAEAGSAVIHGFVTGYTRASAIDVFCQPVGRPRAAQRHTCEDDPYFQFTVRSGSAHTIVVHPRTEEALSIEIEHMKSFAHVKHLLAGEVSRVDPQLFTGEIHVRDVEQWKGARMGLFDLATRRLVWTWRVEGDRNLRNVPPGAYRIGRIGDQGGNREEWLTPEFTVRGAAPSRPQHASQPR